MMYNEDENGYMEQEDEWEREGLLDPAWEKQQKKVSRSIFVLLGWLWVISCSCLIPKRCHILCVTIRTFFNVFANNCPVCIH